MDVQEKIKKLSAPVPFRGNCQYKAPYSRELEGKAFDLVFDDGYELSMSFPTRDKILLSENGGPACLDTCYCMKAEEGAYLLLTEKKDSKPRAGLVLALDVNAGLVTADFMLQGTDPTYPDLVTRTVRFGYIKDGDRPAPVERHYYTRELIGKKIEWRYSPEFAIVHVYCGAETYFATMRNVTPEQAEKFRKEREALGLPPIPLTTEPTFYVHIRDNLFLLSFVEKNLGSGTQGLFLINTDRLTDVGCFWGTNPDRAPEGYMFSAYGQWVTEHLPQEDILADQFR